MSKQWIEDIIKWELKNDERVMKFGFNQKDDISYVWYNPIDSYGETIETELKEAISYIAFRYDISYDELINPLLIEKRYGSPVYVVFGVQHVSTPFTLHPWLIVVDDSNIIEDNITLGFLEKELNIRPHAWGVSSDQWGNVGPICRVVKTKNPEEIIVFLSEEENGIVCYTSNIEKK